jgi:3-deoxy-D-manno-octulosonate 8-phosphate phosphatase KdsC-like HAD superfamily phosphatase
MKIQVALINGQESQLIGQRMTNPIVRKIKMAIAIKAKYLKK